MKCWVEGVQVASDLLTVRDDTSRGLMPQPAALGPIGYPRVLQLRVKHQEVLRELLLGHLDFDFCHGLVQANSDESLWKYVINSLQGVILTEQDVAVELEVFEMPQTLVERG